jgi:lipoprotein-anchoring transpeptidase ErfK/SrfK
MGSKTLRFGKLFFCLRVGAACVAAFVLISSDRNQAYARELVNWDGDHGMATIIVKTPERKLCFVLGKGMALRHDVAVGKDGMQWSGETFVQGKSRNPGWMPTPRMRHENPAPPAHMPLAPTNPLVARAVHLGWTDYHIHGTNVSSSIGRAASSGRIRMHNPDVVDSFKRGHIAAPVQVIQRS